MKFKLIIDPNQEEQVVVTAHAPSALTHRLEQLVLDEEGGQVTGYTDTDTVLLPYEAIECVTVVEGKTYAITADGQRCRLRQRLYEMEQRLPDCFLRINKSTLANRHRLVRFSASFSGGVDAVFRSGYTDYVSRRCLADIKRRLEQT